MGVANVRLVDDERPARHLNGRRATLCADPRPGNQIALRRAKPFSRAGPQLTNTDIGRREVGSINPDKWDPN
jgi:hypothetical protein